MITCYAFGSAPPFAQGLVRDLRVRWVLEEAGLPQDHAEQRAPRYAHRWQVHDVLVWDNASVQHKASGDFPMGEPRRFYRFMSAGSKPV